jgi:SWIM zinc finger
MTYQINSKEFQTQKATITKPEISATAIYKVTVKATGMQCYAVPSDSQPGVYYITCWNEVESRWTCTCKCGQVGRSTCKHARAAQVSVLANKAEADRRREQEAQMAELVQEMAATEQAVCRLSREEYIAEFAIYE